LKFHIENSVQSLVGGACQTRRFNNQGLKVALWGCKECPCVASALKAIIGHDILTFYMSIYHLDVNASGCSENPDANRHWIYSAAFGQSVWRTFASSPKTVSHSNLTPDRYWHDLSARGNFAAIYDKRSIGQKMQFDMILARDILR
jgi:hypothetical protein